jgi:spore coat polysaccharide biosynthesis predicted glycosyltransferase SpsG
VKILFIPVSSKKGIGEYMRSLILAEAIKQEWPAAEIHFALSKEAPYSSTCPYKTILTERSPTHHVKEINQYIEEFKPDVVIFDASGRSMQLAKAKEMGALTVFIAQHDKKIRKGMRISRLKNTDLFWIAQPEFTVKKLSKIDTLKLNLLNKDIPIFLGCLFSMPNEQQEKDILSKYQLQSKNYIFVSAGSGGHYLANGSSAAEGFNRAVRLLELPYVQVWGANYQGEKRLPDGSNLNLSSISNIEFICLLKNSKVALINGGDTLLQCISLKIPFLSVPVSADQPQRIQKALRKSPCFLAAEAKIEDIQAKLKILVDDQVQQQLILKMASIEVNNGYYESVKSLKKFHNTRTH